MVYFYIDESGHTGPNLFDPAQPRLYYGVVSTETNLDELWIEEVASLRLQLAGRRLHAAELGNRGLLSVSRELGLISRTANLQLDICQVAKPDIAIISFFDQVFDQGLNPAVTWSGYWTPLRFMLLIKVAVLFDQDLALRAWSARLDLNEARATEELVALCGELRARVDRLPDERSKQIIGDALEWAALHPRAIGYSPRTKADRLAAMPSVFGFQAVVNGISTLLRENGQTASRIVVDRQSQFNKAQRSLLEFYQSVQPARYFSGLGLPALDTRDIPETPLEFVAGHESLGLGLVDAYLWMYSRALAGHELPGRLQQLLLPPAEQGRFHEISLGAMESYWARYFLELPEPSKQDLTRAQELISADEERRLRAVGKDA